MADILQVDQLSKEYKGFTLRDVNFCLPEGSVKMCIRDRMR